MKIQCDVCNKEEASLFCSADEAALCHACDHRVHHANKLAGKHHRFSLLHPSSKDFPRCDICQEKRAFLFCREDRAILCRDCDLPIHTANEHTTKHHRFLLTGVKLSSSPSTITTTTTTAPLPSNGDCDTATPTEVSSSQLAMKKKPNSVSDPPPSILAHTTTSKVGDDVSASLGGSTSSISEYLIELPGWQVDDLLDSSAPFGYCKIDFTPPFLDADLESNLSLSSEDFGIWEPQVPQAPPTPNYNFAVHNGYTKVSTQASSLTLRSNKRMNDDGLTVPQISPPSSKRLRPYHPFFC
ncbi:B-box zinc finger protein 21-like isoform X2 [Telopea speciosissima]|uniref:B-box zinc finger protein 21-like isoform X2 n=1 Tax=Telopea speciosissima TaxID=54955 RepID=UPI001CC696AE|nr:B-box zinc finger protein 21-like isoform X2 [Telopea speciosissima]